MSCGIAVCRETIIDTVEMVIGNCNHILAAHIAFQRDNIEQRDNIDIYELQSGYTSDELHTFLNSLPSIKEHDDDDIEGWTTDSGCSEYPVIIWLDDGSWLELEFDDYGMDWRHYKCPKIPDHLTKRAQLQQFHNKIKQSGLSQYIPIEVTYNIIKN
jgi:hypothetical protein